MIAFQWDLVVFDSTLLLLADEGVGHDAQLLDLSALLLRQVLHGLLGVEAGPGGAVALKLPLVLPRLQRALKGLVGSRRQRREWISGSHWEV